MSLQCTLQQKNCLNLTYMASFHHFCLKQSKIGQILYDRGVHSFFVTLYAALTPPTVRKICQKSIFFAVRGIFKKDFLHCTYCIHIDTLPWWHLLRNDAGAWGLSWAEEDLHSVLFKCKNVAGMWMAYACIYTLDWKRSLLLLLLGFCGHVNSKCDIQEAAGKHSLLALLAVTGNFGPLFPILGTTTRRDAEKMT